MVAGHTILLFFVCLFVFLFWFLLNWPDKNTYKNLYDNKNATQQNKQTQLLQEAVLPC